MSNTFTNTAPASVFKPEYRTMVQKRLNHPTTWKQICRVEYTDSNLISNPYFSTFGTVGGGTRGSTFSFQDVALTNDTILINDYDEIATYIDWADFYQLGFDMKMELATRMGALMNEDIEAVMLSKYTAWTDFGLSSIGGGGAATDPITVSASNIDDMIRGIHREIREGNGDMYFTEFGSFADWRVADFEYLEAFAQANGFNTADQNLTNGIKGGFRYMGMNHYYSNDHTANHVFAGVRNLFHLGICRSTYGQPQFIENPAGGSGGHLSGLGIHMRVDMQFEAWNNISGLLFDVNVA